MNEWQPIKTFNRKSTGTNDYCSPDDIGQVLKRNLDNHISYRDYIKTKSKRGHF